MTVADRFEAFFIEANDCRPYPWQKALVARIAESGGWPNVISAPTGAGKSSVVDIHVFLVAEWARTRSQAPETVTRPPRRLVLVAPRRVLVDDQYERAQRLARRLDKAAGSSGVLAESAASLRNLATARADDGQAPALGVAQLRGGVLLDSSWRLDPSLCQVVCATPQMWGSRLLLRGYRGSRRSRNLETGLLCHDVAVVIDEAHLHMRLIDTARKTVSMSPSRAALQVVAMSATPRGPGGHALTSADYDTPALDRRVRAAKTVDRIEVEDWRRRSRGALAARAREIHGAGTVGVFVNTVAAALEVGADLGSDSTVNVVVVCGRLRPADLDRIRGTYPGLLDARGNRDVDYLVTTQSLEVGVDLDLPALVTEIAPAPALAQRAGRLNRSGRWESTSFSVLCPERATLANSELLGEPFVPYSKAEIVDASRWLDQLAGDASPERIAKVHLPHLDSPPLPDLTRVELETLAITNDVLAADVDPAFYIDEPQRAVEGSDRSVSIGARDHLLLASTEDVGSQRQLSPETVSQALRAVPPRDHELATMRIGRELDGLLEPRRGIWVIRSVDGDLKIEQMEDDDRLRNGDVVVLPAGRKVLTQGVVGRVAGRSASPIDDVMHMRAPHGDAVLRLRAAEVADLVDADPALGRRGTRDALAEIVGRSGHPRAAQAAERLRSHSHLSELELTWCFDPLSHDDDGLLAIRSTDREGRLPRAAVAGEGNGVVTLGAHAAAVMERTRRILDALGWDALEEVRNRVLDASRYHDEGKRHPRFQLRMGAAATLAEPVAKPVPGHRADRGDGWRHEQLSAAVASIRSGRDSLTVALVAAHHGHGRPLFNRDDVAVLDGCDDPEVADERVVAELARLFGPAGDYEAMRARLQHEIGIHRLAYLEALLRCADIQISREGC